MKGRSGDIGTCMSSSRKVDVWVVLSQVCGIGYFAAWSISFYPQLILNYRRKHTQGLSPDFVYLNPLGFLALTIWSWGMYFIPLARAQYAQRHDGHGPEVSGADLAFSAHALVISTITLLQVWYYARLGRRKKGKRRVTGETTRLLDEPAYQRSAGAQSQLARTQIEHWRHQAADAPGRRKSMASLLDKTVPTSTTTPSIPVQILLYALFVGPFICAMFVWERSFALEVLDWLYFVSGEKLVVSLVKYIPQVMLNWRLRSVEGFAIGQIVLDLTGSGLSLLQLIIDSVFISHDTSGIIANPAKLGLAALSASFDLVLLTQKYLFFRQERPPDEERDGRGAEAS